MAQSASRIEVEKFRAEVHQRFRGTQRLAGTMRVRTLKGAAGEYMPTIGQVETKKRRGPGSPFQVQDPGWQRPFCGVDQEEVAIPSDPQYSIMHNADERSEYAEQVGQALGRAMDDIKLLTLKELTPHTSQNKAVSAWANATDIPSTDSAWRALQDNATLKSNTNSFFRDLLRAVSVLFKVREIEDKITMVFPASWVDNALADDVLTNNDHLTQQMTRTGMVTDPIYGIKLVSIGANRTKGLLDQDTGYAYSRRAVGIVEQYEKQNIDWIPERNSWLVSGLLTVGGVAIDQKGMVRIQRAA